MNPASQTAANTHEIWKNGKLIAKAISKNAAERKIDEMIEVNQSKTAKSLKKKR